MAEEKKEQTAETVEEGHENTGGKKKVIVIAAVSLLFMIAAGAGFLLLGGKGEEEGHDMPAEHGEHAPAVSDQSFFYEMPDMTVNLASSGARFLRLKVSLEVSKESDLAEVKAIEPRLLDDFQAYLRELRPEDLKGSAGSYRLRHDLLLRANQAAQPVVVTRVLFKEFLVQ